MFLVLIRSMRVSCNTTCLSGFCYILWIYVQNVFFLPVPRNKKHVCWCLNWRNIKESWLLLYLYCTPQSKRRWENGYRQLQLNYDEPRGSKLLDYQYWHKTWYICSCKRRLFLWFLLYLYCTPQSKMNYAEQAGGFESSGLPVLTQN